jgi:hypothetical protein
MAKGGNEILQSIERYFSARCDLLSKMKGQQSDLGEKQGRGVSWDYDPHEHLGAEQRRQLQFMDDREVNRIWISLHEVQSSAAGLYRLLQTALYPGSSRSMQ